jgi:hypothetical protein
VRETDRGKREKGMQDITSEDERYMGIRVFMMSNGGVELHMVDSDGKPDAFDFYTCIRCGYAPVDTTEYAPAGHLCRGFDVIGGNRVTGGCLEELTLRADVDTMWYNCWATTIGEENEE